MDGFSLPPRLSYGNSWFPPLPPFSARPGWLPGVPPPPKRKVFVSYHHGEPHRLGDQYWADAFRDLFGDIYEVFYDKSLNRPIVSQNLRYVDRRIREDFITGSSATVLLCGPETWKRKCVDWELWSTLDKRHGLLGIALPTALSNSEDSIPVPGRYLLNWRIGYARWLRWIRDPSVLQRALEASVSSSQRVVPNNSLPKMERNRP